MEPGRVVPGSVLFAAAPWWTSAGRHGRGTGCCSARTPRRGHCLPALGAAGGPSDRIRFQFLFLLVYTLISASGNPSAQRLRPRRPPPADACASGSYLQFYARPLGAPRVLWVPLCSLTIPVPVASSADFLGLRLVTSPAWPSWAKSPLSRWVDWDCWPGPGPPRRGQLPVWGRQWGS